MSAIETFSAEASMLNFLPHSIVGPTGV